MKFRKTALFVTGLFLFSVGVSLFAQSQADLDAKKRDIIVILDVSGSMNDDNKFVNVKNYLDREVIDKLLKNGDDFTLVLFGTNARELFTRTIHSDAERAALKADIQRLDTSDNYTDIGLALEKTSEIIERVEKNDTRRIILFITDGLNIPAPGSKYQGANISVDERFRSLGERISRGAWFCYVIGIGGQTAAGDIAGLVPGSELVNTDSALSGTDVNARITQQEEAERAREDEARRLEEERRLEEQRNAGFMGFLRRLAASMGISLSALIVGFLLLLLLLILLIVFIIRAFRVRELVVTDESETLIKKVPPFGGFILNSPSAILPGIGNENNRVIRVNRNIVRFTVQIMDSGAIAETSPYKKQGNHPLKGVISLANGRLIRITVR